MKAYATSGGGVMFVPDTLERKISKLSGTNDNQDSEE